MDKKISIIIPIYNASAYLEKCLQSVCNQTYPKLEVICIDDGSTDESGVIAEAFAQKDDRFVVIHKENGGESSARNVGLLRCTGDFIGFLDCDDWIEPEMYESLLATMDKYDVDMVASSWFNDTETQSTEIMNKLPVTENVIHRELLLEYVYKRDSYRGFAYMWNKLYRRELLWDQNKPILFNEKLQLGGDVLFLSEMILKTKKAKYLDKAFYHYFQREDSGCHTLNIDKRMDWLTAYKMIINNFEKEKIDVYILELVKRFLAYHSSNVAQIAYEQRDKKALQRCQVIMKRYSSEYIKTNEDHIDRIDRFKRILNYI